MSSRKHEAEKLPDLGQRAHDLMKQHEEEAEVLLNEQWEQQVPAHIIYTVAVIAGGFVLNLLILVAVSGG